MCALEQSIADDGLTTCLKDGHRIAGQFYLSLKKRV